MQSRSAAIKVDVAHGGIECPQSQERTCNVFACPTPSPTPAPTPAPTPPPTPADSTPVITVTGSNSITVEATTSAVYVDQGATCTDAVWGNLSPTTAGSVDNSKPGPYTMTYSCTNPAPWKRSATQKTRKVTVRDTTKPVCKLTGAQDLTVEASFPYVDDGASCADSLDGKINVQVHGTVNVEAAGVYVIRYTATDAAGNPADAITRKVTVKDTLKPVIGLSVGNNYIHVSKGDDKGVRGEKNLAVNYFSLMAEAGAGQRSWMVAAAAAAISGVALFVAHVRKSQEPSDVIEV